MTVIHAPLWQGYQHIQALWFSHQLYPEHLRQQHILDYWQTGSVAYRFRDGDLLLWRQAQSLRCEYTPGLALCKLGSVLTSAPFTASEIKRLGPADAYIVTGAEAQRLYYTDAMRLKPYEWIDLSAYPLQAAILLPSAPQILPELVVPEQAPSIHRLFAGTIPEPAAERNQILQQLATQSTPSDHSALSPRTATAISLVTSITGLLMAAFASVFLLPIFLRRSSPGQSVATTTPQPAQQPASAPAAAQGPATPASPSRFQKWLEKLHMLTGLSRRFDQQHTAYMKKMLQMFEQGELDEALRHAIPLGNAGDISLGKSAGKLAPRQHLEISSGRKAVGGLLSAHPDLHAYLERIYQQAYDHYDHIGDIDKAAYILAELLNRKQAALDYLEKHQRYAQAADLCVNWQMSPTIAIRLYLLAGNIAQVNLLGTTTHCFAAAIHSLGDRHPEHVRTLRRLWAEHLIEQGFWLQAVDAIWPVPEERERAIQWLRQVEQVYGELGLRAWLQRLMLEPEQCALEMDRALALCQQDSAAFHRAIALIFALQQQYTTPPPAALIHLWTPFLLADWQQGKLQLAPKELRKWVDWSQNALLRADLPKISAQESASAQSQAQWAHTELKLDAPDPGLWHLHDVMPLSSGRTLLALGESGLVMIDDAQQVLLRFNMPAFRIVLADSQEVALLLTHRAEGWLVYRVDLVTGASKALGLTDIDHYAPTFDGMSWLVAKDQTLQIVDTRASARQLLFAPTATSGVIRQLGRYGNTEIVICESAFGCTVSHYQPPYRRLSYDETLPRPATGPDQWLRVHKGLVAVHFYADPATEDLCLLSCERSMRQLAQMGNDIRLTKPPHLAEFEHACAYWLRNWYIIRLDYPQHAIWLGYHASSTSPKLILNWQDADDPTFAHVEGLWTFFDQRGRYIRIEENTLKVQHVTLT